VEAFIAAHQLLRTYTADASAKIIAERKGESMAQITDTHRLLTGSELRPAAGARLLGPADPSEILRVSLCLRRRPDGPPPLDHAHWIATPPGRRKFLSNEEFAAKYGASQADLDTIARFARSQDLEVVETSIMGRTVVLSGTAERMSQVFAVELKRYEREAGNYRGHEGPIHIPIEIADAVVAVFGLDNRRVGYHNAVGDPPGTTTLLGGPPQVAKQYNFPSTPPDATGQIIGILAFGGGWNQDRNTGHGPDIDATLGLWGSQTTVPVDVPVTGTNNPGVNPGADSEVILDICVAASVAPGATIQVYWGSDTSSAADWLTVLKEVVDANKQPRPSVLSNSWVLLHADDIVEGVSASQVNQISMKFQDLGMMGVTVFTASGDDGSRSKTPDGKAHVEYPASDPHVTSCGGTTLSLNPPAEWVWNDLTPDPNDPNKTKPWATGGGVSAFFKAHLPAWQQGVNVPPSINDGTIGRGVPDVAGNASLNSGYQLIFNRSSTVIGGTSAVAPFYAGLMALINERLIQNVGFLNPTLYFFRSTVCRDINDQLFPGSPPDNGVPAWTAPTGQRFPPARGYPSAPWWDACTGLGTIDGTVLLGALQQPIPRQNNWRWCFKCQGLFYAGLWAPNLVPPPPIHFGVRDRPEPGIPFPPGPPGPFPPNTCLAGVCPADHQTHDASQSGPYAVVRGVGGGEQGGWRWCHKCAGLFFAGNPSQGPYQGYCPADNLTHDGSQSVHYAAVLGEEDAGQQGGWRLCRKCQGMFFGQNMSFGPCPAGGVHDPIGSMDYAMLWGATGNLNCGIIEKPDFPPS
jgi:kumamolisin